MGSQSNEPPGRTDNPAKWAAGHISEYVATGGEKGHIWNGATTALLTTRGRKSGQWRRTAVIYIVDGDDYIIVASNAGRPSHPNWYLSLVAEPRVWLQVRNKEFSAVARTVGPDQRRRLWPMLIRTWPDYVTYQERTNRDLPVVAIHRA